MPDTGDPVVFVSYAHEDRDRVAPLVARFQQQGWGVWWDTQLGIGDLWRDVLEDRLRHARAVCVVWTAVSIASPFVRDEAARASARGVLVPVLLDRVEPPLGFGELQCADLSGPGRRRAMERVLAAVGRLVDAMAAVDDWDQSEWQTRTAIGGADEARSFLARIRTLSDMFAENPGAAEGLRSSLRGIRDTCLVVGRSIDTFLAPAVAGRAVTLARYRPLAEGRLLTTIQRDRGHCKRIAQIYIESGGLRDRLPPSVSAAMTRELDELVVSMSHADGDLFDAMAMVGAALTRDAGVLTNLLLAGQEAEAVARLRTFEGPLIPLRQKVQEAMAELERLTAELGLEL